MDFEPFFLEIGTLDEMNDHTIPAINDVESLVDAVRGGFRPKYLFFWGHQARRDGQIGKGCLSQWWPSAFEVDGVDYPTAEHYMMAEKARLFGDDESLSRILAAPHPGAAKNLGRAVTGFDEQVWQQRRYGIVLQGNEAKYAQNEELRTFLLNTKMRIIVEASPMDPIWGIGLAEDDPRVQNPEEWRGLNLLGFALMEVRSVLQEELSAEIKLKLENFRDSSLRSE